MWNPYVLCLEEFWHEKIVVNFDKKDRDSRTNKNSTSPV